MDRVFFRFYATLNDFLPPGRKQREFVHSFLDRTSIKDMIETLGVPHTEVDLILVNSEAIDFSYIAREGDRISVYPFFETIDITPLLRVRPKRLELHRFILDTHLGKLADYLRLLGFDALYRNDYLDQDLARISSTSERILLTRDKGVLKRSEVSHGYWIRETDPQKQILEVVRRYGLEESIIPFQRCMRCNGLLEEIQKEEIKDRLPPKTNEYYNKFNICPSCDQIYWQGSHYQRMKQFIDDIFEKLRTFK
jgi:uncharacterized protein